MKWQFFLKYDNNEVQIPEPVGWGNISFMLKRDMKNYGLTFEFSETLSFFGEARKFIFDAYENGNIDALIDIRIEYQDSPYTHTSDNTNGWVSFYNGILVLKDLQISKDFAKCKIEPTDFNRKFRNTYDLDTQITPNKEVKLHSKIVRKISDRKTQNDFLDFTINVLQSYIWAGKPLKLTAQYLIFPNTSEVEDNNSLDGKLYKTWYSDGGFGSGYFNSDSTDDKNTQTIFNFKEKGDCIVRTKIKGKLEWQALNGSKFETQLRPFFCLTNENPDINGNTNILYQSFILSSISYIADTTSVNNLIGQINFDFDETQTFDPYAIGKNFFNGFVLDFNVINLGIFGTFGGNFKFTFDEVSFVEVKQQTITIPSTTKGINVMNAFNEILFKNVGFPNRFRSDFLQNLDNFNILTNGFLLRKLDNKPLTTNFQKLYEGFRNIFNLGISVVKESGEDIVRVEPMKYFFDKSIILTLDNPNNLELSVATDLYFNKILLGYKEWQNQNNGQTNGLDEFNSTRQYGLDIRLGQYLDGEKNRKELNIISELITAGYLIEAQRRLLTEPSKDGSYDNHIFIIALNRGAVTSNLYTDNQTTKTYNLGEISERNENVGVVENILSPQTAYNLRYSPLRNLINWVPYIKAQLIKGIQNFKFLKYKSTTGNSELLTNNFVGAFDEFAISEKINLDTTYLAPEFKPIFEAQWVECDYPLSFEQFNLLRNNYTKRILINVGETKIKGYIESVKYNPNKGLANIKMIRAYDFYSYYGGLFFDGINDTIQVPYNPQWDFGSYDDFTISAFVDMRSVAIGAGFCPIFGNVNNSFTGKGYLLSIAPNYIVFTQRSSIFTNDWAQIACFNSDIQFGEVVHIGISKKGNNVNDWKFYLNGGLQFNLITNNNLTGDSKRGNAPAYIGLLPASNEQSDYNASMILYDLKVFNQAYSNSDVKTLYETKNEEFILGTDVLNLTLNQKQGLTTIDEASSDTCILQGYSGANTSLGNGNSWRNNNGNAWLQ